MTGITFVYGDYDYLNEPFTRHWERYSYVHGSPGFNGAMLVKVTEKTLVFLVYS